MSLQLIFADVYRKKERHTQISQHCWLGLQISGLIYSHTWYPDGKLLCDSDLNTPPYLLLRPPKVKVDFQYGEGRENWVVQFRHPELNYDQESHRIILENNGHRFELPPNIFLKPEQVTNFQQTMSEIRQLYHSQLPRNLLAAALKTEAILACFLEQAEPFPRSGPADKLKQLIDADVKFSATLQELSQAAGGNVDHLRRLFRQRYQLDPGEYRTRCRLQRIMHLISHTRLSLKEIADQTGMNHVTHLHRLIRQHYHTTPGALLRQHRGV